MKFGITQQFDCGYLPEQQEQLLVLMNEDEQTANHYGQLIQIGFRRSGEQIYRPHCPACNACQSVRIPVNEFIPSRSQKRIVNKARQFKRVVSDKVSDDYYEMYERYINHRHRDGAMYPPSYSQFEQFVNCSWKKPVYLEAWDNDKLIAVAVTDKVDDHCGHQALSALYTFFEPGYESFSLGTWMILQQIAVAREISYPYLYLGYYVGECQKMAYKRQFYPHEVLNGPNWLRFDKKTHC